ncbi:hypothetical protein [Chitinophaga sp. 212800010-3]|uniref:hypothetical protein n=1 Tax=unclassified Chitinophaga TaxID=2619133 RepID=UPI002DECBAE2|nr:hypothetical protein [Chitinophaga sp. 212800010-3]
MNKFSCNWQSFGVESSLELFKDLENTSFGMAITNIPKEQRGPLLEKLVDELEQLIKTTTDLQKSNGNRDEIKETLNILIEKYHYYNFAYFTFFKKFREEKNKTENSMQHEEN